MPKRILIVEDELDFLELLKFRLEQCNYEVYSAQTGLAAFDMARQCQPDAILLDVLLPDFDGLTVCDNLRRFRATCDLPVIVITAVANDTTRELARIAGATDFFGKPLDFDGLTARLKTLLP